MMEAKWMKPVLEANKAAVQSWYQSVSSMQDQTEQILTELWDQAPLVPEENKKICKQWMEMCKKERQNMQKTLEQGFETMEKFLSFPAAKQEESSEKTKATASKSAA
ncbi:MAG: hypothetical protein R6U22_08570 [Desulfohalobiaceae bacterium]